MIHIHMSPNQGSAFCAQWSHEFLFDSSFKKMCYAWKVWLVIKEQLTHAGAIVTVA